MTEALLTKNVFIAGRYPPLTYSSRDERSQEAELRAYLDDQGKALTISGPSKSGKTVLVEHVIPADEAIWINGNDIETVDDLYRRIVEWYGLFDALEVQGQSGKSLNGQIGLNAGVVDASLGGTLAKSKATKQSRTRPIDVVAMSALSDLPVPIIIDDFHYVPADVKHRITRAIKGLIQRTHVIMIAVPHEAFEPLRLEPEMNGRIWSQAILPWDEEELVEIATKGFALLNVVDHGEVIAKELASASLGAPFLMQQLCLDYMHASNIFWTVQPAIDLSVESDWAAFYRRVANRIVPGVFDALVKGPKAHGKSRSPRALKDGTAVTDIYGAILHAIGHLGPRRSIHYTLITQTIAASFTEPPGSQQITASLGHLAAIADERRGSGDAAVDYKNDELHILDPFLSFYLRFGSWELPTAPAS